MLKPGGKAAFVVVIGKKGTKAGATAKTVMVCLVLAIGGSASAQRIWISRGELAELPTTGQAWQRLKAQADRSAGAPNLSDQNQKNNVYVLAKALVYARIGEEHYRMEVISQCMRAIGTEQGGRTLALGRELAAYVIAADLVGLPPDKDCQFRTWLRKVLTEMLHGKTLQSTHERRPNNWGTHAGASRAAVAAYLGDRAELERTALVFRAWLGDVEAEYSGFEFGELSWQCDPSQPKGVNPKGCQKDGHSIDGVLPDDQRRSSGGFTWPPPKEGYTYGALQGAIVQAVILHRAGYDTFRWGDKALLRAYRWLRTEADYEPTGDDTWQLPLVDHFYGTDFWDGTPTRCGKNMCWTDWSHAKSNHGGLASPP